MPQLELFGLTSQIFWLIVNFSIIYLIVSRYIDPKIRNIINTRNRIINSDIEQAKELNSKSEILLKEYEQEVNLIKSNALNIINIAEKKAKSNKESMLITLNEQIEKDYLKAKNQIDSSFTNYNQKNELTKIILVINENLFSSYFSSNIINEHLENKF